MILILEGPNGAGKTTIAKHLDDKYGFRNFRPFKDPYKGHWGDGGDVERRLKDLGIPVNTIAEDIFMAEFISKFHRNLPGILLDRSLPSALSYSCLGFDARQQYLELWLKLLADVDILYVHLDVSFENASKRAPDRVLTPMEHNEIRRQFAKIYASLPISQRINKIAIGTDDKGAYEVIALVDDVVETWVRRCDFDDTGWVSLE